MKFKPTPRINGFLYILDENDNFVGINGKKKRFKSVSACAKFILELEELLKHRELLEKEG